MTAVQTTIEIVTITIRIMVKAKLVFWGDVTFGVTVGSIVGVGVQITTGVGVGLADWLGLICVCRTAGASEGIVISAILVAEVILFQSVEN